MLRLNEEARQRMWDLVVAKIGKYQATVDNLPVSPQDSAAQIRAAIETFDFSQQQEPAAVAEFAVGQLTRNQVHTPSANYYGLFNPCPTDMGVFADALTAAFNPQLAAWNHSPFAIELEQHLIRTFGRLFGYLPEHIDGTFTTGGAEANHTALICSLTHRFAQFPKKGLRSLSTQPLIYVSAEAHHSLLKAARLCGLGTDAVREIPVDSALRLDAKVLERFIAEDIKSNSQPLLIVATAGTTNAGAIDPIKALSDLAVKYHAWFHVDAAWGGAAAFLPELKNAIDGIANADSITFDCHKWLSVPMGAGMFMTRHTDVLDRAFRVATDYMPKDGTELGFVDPYAHSIQWSRRFIGLKVFMSLAAAGLPGYADAIRHQVAMGTLLRESLRSDEWDVVNETPLPIVCFTGKSKEEKTQAFVEQIAQRVVSSGKAWISTTKVGHGHHVLRACITNYRTQEEHVRALVAALAEARRSLAALTGTGT